ncbi:MAG TPA: QueT transporter family protein [Candidatus Fimivivens faecavium]|nr:QueT transporter family protein [Candidatus Fimivivens faecavium]
MKKTNVQNLTRTALIAALYFVISTAFAPLAYGVVQVRFSEALTLLPVLTALGVPGVTLGCLLTNAYGVASGMSILGALDVFLGTGATLLAAAMSRALRGIRLFGLPVWSAVPPVLVNAVVVGGEFAFAETGKVWGPVFWFNAAQVGLGQLAACFVIGLPMVFALEKTGAAKKLFE